MKTTWIKKTGLAILGMLVMSYASAIEPTIKTSGEKKIKLVLDNVSENENLMIKDFYGFTIYSEIIEKSNKAYVKSFDLTTLSDGKYVIELEGSLRLVSYAICIADNKICSGDIIKTITFKPTVIQKGTKVYVSKYNPDNSCLNINIYNNDNNSVYEETLAGKANLKRIFDFSKVKGEFRIEMSIGNKTYTQVVSINE